MNWINVTGQWYLVLLVIGLIFLPTAKLLLGRFFDWGYGFSKVIGIIFISYLAFVFSWTHLIPFGLPTLILIIFLSIGINILIAQRIGFFKNIGKAPIILWIVQEIIFVACLYFWTQVRGQEPSVRGLEKFMDFGFMQSIGRAKFFPPADMWLAGNSINYYYFGHLSGAVLTKISGIAGHLTYNLILATLFALGISQGFSLCLSLAKSFIKNSAAQILAFAILGTLLINIGGNLHPLYLFTKGYKNEFPEAPWKVTKGEAEWKSFKEKLFGDSAKGLLTVLGQESNYWYPNATRFIKNTIHEFPIYSYVVADLHGHVFDIPFVIFTLALILNLFIGPIDKIRSLLNHNRQQQDRHKKHRHQPHADIGRIESESVSISSVEWSSIFNIRNLYLPLLLGFMVAVHYMTNAFDGPIYFLITMAAVIIYSFFGHDKNYTYAQKSLLSFFSVLLIGVGFVIFSFPFNSGFKPFVSGVGVNCGWDFASAFFKSTETVIKKGPFLFEKGNCQISPTYQLLILWGFFWFNMFWMWLPILTKMILKKYSWPKDGSGWMDIFASILFGVGTFLLLVPEYFYIKDIYPTHFRANTMFKLGYQAFIMMSIASCYVIFRIKDITRNKFALGIYWFSIAIMLTLILLYPTYAINSYYGELKKPVSLNGQKWMSEQFPEYLEIVEYLNKNIKGQPRVLEAQGDSYTDFNLVSAYTGLPTIGGWWVHEWLWRGNSEILGKLTPDIVSIYESTDPQRSKDLLNKYQIKYFIIGPHEKAKYKNTSEATLSSLGTLLLRSKNGKAALYQVK